MKFLSNIFICFSLFATSIFAGITIGTNQISDCSYGTSLVSRITIGPQIAWARSTTTIYSDLSEDDGRLMLFNDYALTNDTPPTWVHEGNLMAGTYNRQLLRGTNHYHRSGWSLISCRAGAFGYQGLSVPPLIPSTVPIYPTIASNLAANLRNDLGAHLDSPVFTNGVGTLYFEAINGVANRSMDLIVSVATNAVMGTNGLEYAWLQVGTNITLNASATNQFYRYSYLFNYRQWMKIRIRRASTVSGGSLESNFLVIDNLRISPPPTDERAYKSPDYTGEGYDYPVEMK